MQAMTNEDERVYNADSIEIAEQKLDKILPLLDGMVSGGRIFGKRSLNINARF
jgi:hypothetical protein